MKQLTANKQIKYGAILSYLGIFAYILIGLLYTPWMIDIIGKDDYGLYTLAYSVISLFVFDFGLSAAVQRFIAKYLAEGAQERVNACLSVVYHSVSKACGAFFSAQSAQTFASQTPVEESKSNFSTI